MRGKQSDPQAIVQHLGITPAGAGKTHRRKLTQTNAQDHPRRCGENLIPSMLRLRNPGSPPQVRGKLMGYHYTNGVDRITPAGAGKTMPINILSFVRQDHPRRCGENKTGSIFGLSALGSPPQVRGKLGQQYPAQTFTGITPAGAGKTSETASMP